MKHLSCGHFILQSDCLYCQRLKRAWYQKIHMVDPDWKDIEYGLEHPERLYEPVRIERLNEFTTEYYNRVLEVYHLWMVEGRSRRDCLIAELLGLQVGDTGTERGIEAALKSRRLKPYSRWTVRQTIKEINGIILQKAQAHLGREQAKSTPHLDSKPLKDEADGQAKKPCPKPQIHIRRAA